MNTKSVITTSSQASSKPSLTTSPTHTTLTRTVASTSADSDAWDEVDLSNGGTLVLVTTLPVGLVLLMVLNYFGLRWICGAEERVEKRRKRAVKKRMDRS
jgi:hypothetical protein